jgi:hypothetical protein
VIVDARETVTPGLRLLAALAVEKSVLVQEVAFDELQVSVEVPDPVSAVGVAEKEPMVGAGGSAPIERFMP